MRQSTLLREAEELNRQNCEEADREEFSVRQEDSVKTEEVEGGKSRESKEEKAAQRQNFFGIGVWLDVLAQKFVLLFTGGFAGLMGLYAWKYTWQFKSYEQEYLENYFDSKFWNVFWLVLTLIIFAALSHWVVSSVKEKETVKKRMRFLLGFVCIYYFLVSVIWVKLSGSIPYGDQLYIVNSAQDFQNGIFDQLHPGGYMDMAPHQLGLSLVIEILYKVFGQGKFYLFQYLNACFMPLMVFSGYQITKSLFQKEEVCLYYLGLMTGCIQLFFYVPYIYGEIGSISLMLTAGMCLIRYMQNIEHKNISKERRQDKKTLFWFLGAAVFASALALLYRENSLIFIIAECLVLFVFALRRNDVRILLSVFILAGSCLIVSKGVEKIYEARADYQIGDGIPAVAYIAMGQQDRWPGPGWYNNYNKECYQIGYFDTEAAAEIAGENLSARLQAYRLNMPAAVEFIKQKILTQWNEPTYEAFFVNNSFAEETVLTEKIFHGKGHSRLAHFMDRHQFLVYMMFAAAALVMLFSRGHIYDILFMAAIIGGLLFSILWEAKSRYILPYFVFMTVYAAYGIYCVHRGIYAAIAGYFRSRQEMLDAAGIDNDREINDAMLGGFDDRRKEDRPEKGRIIWFRKRK